MGHVIKGACKAGVVALVASCTGPPMSAEDKAFDAAVSTALEGKTPIELTELEEGPWTLVCAVGEGRARHMFSADVTARPQERAFNSLIDAGSTWFGPGVGALAFLYPDGVEVRPLSELAVNMGSTLNRCVTRSEAVLAWSPEGGWHFISYPSET